MEWDEDEDECIHEYEFNGKMEGNRPLYVCAFCAAAPEDDPHFCDENGHSWMTTWVKGAFGPQLCRNCGQTEGTKTVNERGQL